MPAPPEWIAHRRQRRSEYVATLEASYPDLDSKTAVAAVTMRDTIVGGHRIDACGNGGSSAQAAHFVAELVGRFAREREPMPAVSLCSNTTTLTA